MRRVSGYMDGSGMVQLPSGGILTPRGLQFLGQSGAGFALSTLIGISNLFLPKQVLTSSLENSQAEVRKNAELSGNISAVSFLDWQAQQSDSIASKLRRIFLCPSFISDDSLEISAISGPNCSILLFKLFHRFN
ncbi:hypothetical protein V6N13_071147 [Hibiscus sabdariffa]